MLNKNWFWCLVITVIITASLYVNPSKKDLPPMADMAMGGAGY